MTEEEVRGVTESAEASAAEMVDVDPVGAELMTAYAVLGDLLSSGRTDAEYVAECRELVDWLVKLGAQEEMEEERRWSVWLAKRSMVDERPPEDVGEPGIDENIEYRPVWPLAWVERCAEPTCAAISTFYVPCAGAYRCELHDTGKGSVRGA